ncbi:hypothetical protein KGF54_002338 [Candida jiufengensis]|uniref:uncharacterized protein n=1 Tax=Candida jiufengensis TaxID=497108 RepID=UPI0022245182|nr:uncharacterized protein KGF54_002338 [Candida jiufengensis]KAI5954563.1 hypothetical protein KGF54_002338 [Candida jiufengensis]
MSLLQKPAPLNSPIAPRSQKSINNLNQYCNDIDFKSILKPTSPSKTNITSPLRSVKINIDSNSSIPRPPNIRNPKLSSSATFNIKSDSPKSSNTLSLEDQKVKLKDTYIQKLKYIQKLEQELSLSKFELKEIECNIEEINRKQLLNSTSSSIPNDFYNQAYIQTEKDLTDLKISNSSKPINQDSPLKTKTSFFINSAIGEIQQIQKKASVIFNNNQSHDKENNRDKENINLSNLLKNSNQKIDTLSRQTSQFFNDIFKDNSDNKEVQHINEFDINHLQNNVQVIYENVDIDEYDSSFDEEEPIDFK